MSESINTNNPWPHLPKMPVSEQEWVAALFALVRYLRGPEGCPWDRKQTTTTFAKCVCEEAQEMTEALEKQDAESIAEEWGDTFFTLLATAAAAETEGVFRVEDALRNAHDKLVRRHAHIFGEHKANTPEEVVDMWNAIKAQEKAARPRS